MKKIFLLFLTVSVFLGACSSSKKVVLKSPSGGKGAITGKTGSTSSKGQSGGTTQSGKSYVERYKTIAIEEMNTYGIPASIKLAQAILESGSGNSYLAQNANNHFGIKCGGVWNGKSVTRPDDNINDCFRVYDNAEQSFKDHSQFLLRKRYERLFLLNKNDYKGWARGLKEAGYATNPRYPELLIDLIERYELYQYDRGEKSYVTKEKREEKVELLIAQKAVDEPKVNTEEIKSAVAMVIHEVKSSDTLYALSKRYNVSVDQIKALNGLSSDSISVGQLLVISK
ncbi:glucosaminidase domain-containing protein [Sphingobacterium psychroaquaticum]|uniref:Peptidoglycan hydrolase n=1 Tax=Sphingobacterium psychroaquaticum TaxID=561061 RepID=A0A1X7KE68_9SPHI|nr:glucosaminidase domain-containing protein [Sphingobacterium psychroaquaticum]SMG38818.1 Flagellum-specific peptidoglycan hydrolase FlgJ [Sphingobacterium psychroaquaticum]